MRSDRPVSGAAFLVLLSSLLVGACTSTPRHSNTLIFGTNTKVAIDASQTPTGTVGITIGYARQEAVWMPLLANKNDGGSLVPQDCEADECRKFVGVSGQGGPAGANALDTYSVFASFGGEVKANAGGGTNNQATASGGAALAQYFATGFAARLLAAQGGAALVNTAAASPDVVAAVHTTLTQEQGKVEKVMAYLTKSDGTLDKTKRDQLVNGVTSFSASTKAYLNGVNDLGRLRETLSTPFSAYGKPLYEALPSGG